MSKKSKGGVKTIPMRALDEQRIPYEVCQQSSKQYMAEGVAADLEVPIAQVVKAMLIQRSNSPADRNCPFVLIVSPGTGGSASKKSAQRWLTKRCNWLHGAMSSE